MCIRDSAQAMVKENDLMRGLSGDVTRRMVFPKKKDDPYPCLLYTSDAADDLPCVDLGGRRSIKKKKKQKSKSLKQSARRQTTNYTVTSRY